MDRDRSRIERFEAMVHGRVQGVGFRVHAARTARDLRLVGWVANRGDGAVEVIAEGDRRSLDALEEALRKGPPGASVQRVEMRRGPARSGLSGFEVRHGAHPGD